MQLVVQCMCERDCDLSIISRWAINHLSVCRLIGCCMAFTHNSTSLFLSSVVLSNLIHYKRSQGIILVYRRLKRFHSTSGKCYCTPAKGSLRAIVKMLDTHLVLAVAYLVHWMQAITNFLKQLQFWSTHLNSYLILWMYTFFINGKRLQLPWLQQSSAHSLSGVQLAHNSYVCWWLRSVHHHYGIPVAAHQTTELTNHAHHALNEMLRSRIVWLQ